MDAERQKKFQAHIDAAGVNVAASGLAEDQGQFLIDRLILAVVGFDTKNPDATEDQAKAFVETVVGKLMTTYKNREANLADKNSARSRAIRKTQIEAISAEHGIKFTFLREEFRFVWPMGTEDENGEPVPLVPIEDEVEQGDKIGVIAFKYHLDHKNKLSVELAMSFCSPKDKFDNLGGKEEALKHFMEGKTMKLEAAQGALFGSLLGRVPPIAIAYATNVLKANGVTRRLKNSFSINGRSLKSIEKEAYENTRQLAGIDESLKQVHDEPVSVTE